MSFETVSLLLNWMEMGALLAILFRLSSTFNLIANTQRELRRAIYHLGERRGAELGTDNAFDRPGIASISLTRPAPLPIPRASWAPTIWPAYRSEIGGQLKQGWYPPAVGGAAVRCREVLGTPVGLPLSRERGQESRLDRVKLTMPR